MITQEHLIKLCDSAANAGFQLNPNDLILLRWEAGLQSHVPLPLPKYSAAVYIFYWDNVCLKVGKTGQNSKARYMSQHYSVDANRSTLAKSLYNDPEFHAKVGAYPDEDWGNWIKQNTTRYNIIMPANLGPKLLHFAEAFFILRCNPHFENGRG